MSENLENKKDVGGDAIRIIRTAWAWAYLYGRNFIGLDYVAVYGGVRTKNEKIIFIFIFIFIFKRDTACFMPGDGQPLGERL
jgi:hypothetical protein